MSHVFTNAALLGENGLAMRDITVDAGRFVAITPAGKSPHIQAEDLGGAIVSPPMCDVQVNGGGGLMLGDCLSVADLKRLADAHLNDGVPHILPTLISDTEDEIARIGALVAQAISEGVWQIQGLHLEGPHLTRAGAHDPAILRPLSDTDLRVYIALKPLVGVLKLTLAPELVPAEMIAALTQAGIIVALGHSTCDSATARAAIDAGACTTTHLFNAMSGLDHRAPGLAAAALNHGRFGLIADGVHVHADMLRIAARHVKGAYLVSDAMAVAGTTDTQFSLSGRTISRENGKLTLEDGTLAGADLTLARAVAVMEHATDLPRAACIAMATCAPRALIGLPSDLTVGAPAVFHIWADGQPPHLIQPD